MVSATFSLPITGAVVWVGRYVQLSASKDLIFVMS